LPTASYSESPPGQRQGFGDRPAQRVVAKRGAVAVGVQDAGQVAARIIGVGGGLGQRVGHRVQQASIIVDIAGGLAGLVDAAQHMARAVIGLRADGTIGVAGLAIAGVEEPGALPGGGTGRRHCVDRRRRRACSSVHDFRGRIGRRLPPCHVPDYLCRHFMDVGIGIGCLDLLQHCERLGIAQLAQTLRRPTAHPTVNPARYGLGATYTWQASETA